MGSAVHGVVTGRPLRFATTARGCSFVCVSSITETFRTVKRRNGPGGRCAVNDKGTEPLGRFVLRVRRALTPGTGPVFNSMPFAKVGVPLRTFSATSVRASYCFGPSISFTRNISGAVR